MPDKCSHCDQKYVLEPGFYWGSMYIGYMLSSGLMLVTFAVLYFLLDFGIYEVFAGIILVTAIFYGLIFRLARSIWINLYVHYDPNTSPRSKS